MDDLISEFLTETNESLDELDVDLVNLEQNPNDSELLSKIFRLMHTIKGTCGFLGLPRLEKLAHHAENVLGRFRDGDLEVTPEYVTLIFESIDGIKFIVSSIEETGAEPQGDDSALIQKLDDVYEGKPAEDASTAQAEEQPEDSAPANANEPEPDEHGFVPVRAGEPFPNLETKAEPEAEALPPAATPAQKIEAPVTTQTLRVNVDVLENLMTMVSELVLTRNQLLQILRTQNESDFAVPLQRLNHVVSDLQEGVMKTRMQPIGNAWSKLPRIIRDLSIELGKKIDLEMRGQDTELDRQVLELIKDPLTHMVRNSGDHGIETPEERKAAGKPETGKILLNAYHEGGHINIEISDDGKGLSAEKIKAKILEKDLASAEELAEMSTQQINQFIFKAGFSTAEKVTSVSGRGVGMDVVRTNIEKIGGSVELISHEGKGSTFIIKIPLTLAIVSALIVEASGERFAIPQLAVRELVMASDKGENRIETIKGTPVYRLRDRLLPLVSLSDLLKLDTSDDILAKLNQPGDINGYEVPSETQDAEVEAEATPAEKAALPKNKYIIVTQVGSYDFGIIVDRVYDTEEIVVKPVATILRHIDLFSGNTILGDGSVIMILDPNGIAKATGDSVESGAMDEAHTQTEHLEDTRQKTSLLLFSAYDSAPKTVPLSLVSRLENVDLSTIERSNNQFMVQYRGQLMPLIPYDPAMTIGDEGEKPVLVFTEKSKSMGLIVDEIIDITEEHIDVQLEAKKPGLMGSAIINQRATDVIDVGYFLSRVDTNWFADHGDEPFQSVNGHGANGHAANGADANAHNGNGRAGRKRVLLVDDSSFFRNMLAPILNVAGYEVISVEGPLQALALCEKGEEFDIIVSDIEMPEMDGFEFASKVKDSPHWQGTPMVALSSHATKQDINRGKDVGFSNHVAKFDREGLLSTLSQALSEQSQMEH